MAPAQSLTLTLTCILSKSDKFLSCFYAKRASAGKETGPSISVVPHLPKKFCVSGSPCAVPCSYTDVARPAELSGGVPLLIGLMRS